MHTYVCTYVHTCSVLMAGSVPCLDFVSMFVCMCMSICLSSAGVGDCRREGRAVHSCQAVIHSWWTVGAGPGGGHRQGGVCGSRGIKVRRISYVLCVTCTHSPLMALYLALYLAFLCVFCEHFYCAECFGKAYWVLVQWQSLHVRTYLHAYARACVYY